MGPDINYVVKLFNSQLRLFVRCDILLRELKQKESGLNELVPAHKFNASVGITSSNLEAGIYINAFFMFRRVLLFHVGWNYNHVLYGYYIVLVLGGASVVQ